MILLAIVLALAVVFKPGKALPQLVRLAIVGAIALTITSYYWLPFLKGLPYMNSILSLNFASTNLPVPKWAAYRQRQWLWSHQRLPDVLSEVFGKQFLDRKRAPLFSLLSVIGIVYALCKRNKTAGITLTLLGLWAPLYVGLRYSRLAKNLLPIGNLLVAQRMSVAIQSAEILAIGLAGEFIWNQFRALRKPWSAFTSALLVGILMVPAMIERHSFYRQNSRAIRSTAERYWEDSGLQDIIAALHKLPSGRVFWRLRTVEDRNAAFFAVPTLNPGQDLSLNTLSIRGFDHTDPRSYDLFNVRYVVVPSRMRLKPFFKLLESKDQYALYQVDTTGYSRIVKAKPGDKLGTNMLKAQSALRERISTWIKGGEAAAGIYLVWDYPPGVHVPPDAYAADGSGTTSGEEVSNDRIAVWSECQAPSTLVFKITYHPNWRVTVDGQPTRTFMTSPSYIGLKVPAGRHHVVAEYHSSWLKTVLLVVGVLVFAASMALRDRFELVADLILARIGRAWPRSQLEGFGEKPVAERAPKLVEGEAIRSP